jgi:hypothetical protein
MDEHSRLGIKINYRKRRIDDFLEVEMLEEGVWYLLGVSFIYNIKQRLYMRTINSGFYIMGT